MNLCFANDHAGFPLKAEIVAALKKMEIAYDDLGCHSLASCNYPEFAHKLAEKVLSEDGMIGIAICGTGLGISMALNRHKGIRAALCHNLFYVEMARKHNDANVLVLAGREIGVDQALAFLKVFLETDFEGGRHLTRVQEIERMGL